MADQQSLSRINEKQLFQHVLDTTAYHECYPPLEKPDVENIAFNRFYMDNIWQCDFESPYA